MVAPINVLVYMAISSPGNKRSHLKVLAADMSLPQSAVVLAMCSNYFKVANLKRSKVRIVHLLSFSSFFSLTSALMRYIKYLKQPPIVIKFSGSSPFALSVTGTYCFSFLRGRLRGESVLAVGSHLSVHMCNKDASTASAWAA